MKISLLKLTTIVDEIESYLNSGLEDERDLAGFSTLLAEYIDRKEILTTAYINTDIIIRDDGEVEEMSMYQALLRADYFRDFLDKAVRDGYIDKLSNMFNYCGNLNEVIAKKMLNTEVDVPEYDEDISDISPAAIDGQLSII